MLLEKQIAILFLNMDVDDSLIFKIIDHSYKQVVDKLTRREKARLNEIMEDRI